jgi:hypothetical protein
MRYKVEFEKNVPVRAAAIRSTKRIEHFTAFEKKDGISSMKFLYVEAENETDAIQQAQRIATTISRF